MENIEQLSINTIRLLGVDAINKAKSGHPGIVLGAAPMAFTLFTRHLKANPADTEWFDRDRFVLSAGHGSALLYSMLHLCGYGLTIDDLKEFRQKGSMTPGHPEYRHTKGVEMTTGPLGQGISTAVGMAIAESYMANKFNKSDIKPINHNTYVICGDGDLEEGISMEACSLAGHLALGKLIVLYDSNDIQLDGEVALTNTDSIKGKFEAMNWQYLRVEDGNDVDAIDEAIKEAKACQNKPTIIEIKTVIGYGAPNSGESAVHGAPLGEDNTKALRKALAYDYEPFDVDKSVYDFFKKTVIEKGDQADSEWSVTLQKYEKKYADDYKELMHFIDNDYEIIDENLPTYEVGSKEATRKILGKMLDQISADMPNAIGGSADLTPSTFVKGANGVFEADTRHGRNIKFGVREHAMTAIVNGITIHGGLKAFGAGFFIFSDYMKPSLRLASIMQIPSIFIFSHDTVCVGEDGPTHQPIEQLTMLRSIPNFDVIRPADAVEVKAALKIAFESKLTPTAITTTRQPLTNLSTTSEDGVRHGAYIAYEPKKKATGIIIACGSELELCIEVAKTLAQQEEYVRVVSMPSQFLFEKQDKKYQEKILPSTITKRLAVEMGHPMSWYKYSKNVYGIDTFGISSPLKYIHEYYGFTVDNLVNVYKNID
ncbi:MAG: transketolase [Acholeplasmatales bacterium]|nr:transketolase [Acholeplasmatales bacterium]